MSFSIVIICRNEELTIGRCLDALTGLTDDIIIVDSGSTDRTIKIIAPYDVKLLHHDWSGYGANKNYGASFAKYDWVLSIDADEIIDENLYQALLIWQPERREPYGLKRINHIGSRALRYGHLKPEWKLRLYNRLTHRWDNRPVHEQLIPDPKKNRSRLLSGTLKHYQASNLAHLNKKYSHYARLSHQTPSRIDFIKPYYYFFKSYVLHLGILERIMGWKLACLFFNYRKLKNSTNTFPTNQDILPPN